MDFTIISLLGTFWNIMMTGSPGSAFDQVPGLELIVADSLGGYSFSSLSICLTIHDQTGSVDTYTCNSCAGLSSGWHKFIDLSIHACNSVLKTYQCARHNVRCGRYHCAQDGCYSFTCGLHSLWGRLIWNHYINNCIFTSATKANHIMIPFTPSCTWEDWTYLSYVLKRLSWAQWGKAC